MFNWQECDLQNWDRHLSEKHILEISDDNLILSGAVHVHQPSRCIVESEIKGYLTLKMNEAKKVYAYVYYDRAKDSSYYAGDEKLSLINCNFASVSEAKESIEKYIIDMGKFFLEYADK
jgi:hypothetical protein